VVLAAAQTPRIPLQVANFEKTNPGKFLPQLIHRSEPWLVRNDYLHCGRIALPAKRLQTGPKMIYRGLVKGVARYRDNDRKDRIAARAHSILLLVTRSFIE